MVSTKYNKIRYMDGSPISSTFRTGFLLYMRKKKCIHLLWDLCSKTLVPAMGGKIKDGKDGFIATIVKIRHNKMQCIISEKGLYKLDLLNNVSTIP